MVQKSDAKLDETRDVTFASRGQIAHPVDTGNPHGNRQADVKRGDPAADPVQNKVPGSNPQESGVVSTGNPQGNRSADSGSINNPTKLPVGTDVVPGQKSSLMKEMIDLISGLPADKIATAIASLTEKEAPKPVDNVANVIAEDLKEIFGAANLSEDFRNKATVIFEAAVSAKVSQRNAELQEAFEAKAVALKEEVTAEVSALYEEKVDMYLSFVAEEWASENKVALETGIRAELSESLMAGLAKLLEDHYVSIPAEKVDALTAVTEELAEKDTKVNTLTTELIEARNLVKGFERKAVVAELSEGLTLVQRDRFVQLAETVTVSDIAEYKTKAAVLKESVTQQSPASTPKKDADAGLNEEVNVVSTEKPAAVKPYESIYRQ